MCVNLQINNKPANIYDEMSTFCVLPGKGYDNIELLTCLNL